MKATITVWTLAWDTREGTNCKVFATEEDLECHLTHIMRDSLSAFSAEDGKTVLSLLDGGDVWGAWEVWCADFKDDLDTYHWDREVLEVEISGREQTACAA